MSGPAPDPATVPDACPACQHVARRLVEAVASFGQLVSDGNGTARDAVVCWAHLPLVVDATAPRELALWLGEAIPSGSRAPASPSPDCLLCRAEREAEEEALSRRWQHGLACPAHPGAGADPVEDLVRALARVASGERLPLREERLALRAALVRYASVRGTRAYVLRIE